MDKWIVVKEYEHRYEAEMDKQLLDQQDIPSYIRADDVAGLYPSLAALKGIQLEVSSEDLETAKALLKVSPLRLIKNNEWFKALWGL